MFWHVITGHLMERAVTYSDHSTTVRTCYFTQAPHKSFGPMTQLLPGPQCPNVTHVPTVLLQISPSPCTPPSLHPLTLLFPPSFHAKPLRPFQHALPPLPLFSYFSHSHSSVCLSACQFVSLIMPCINPLLCSLPRPLVSSPALSLCNIRLDWHPISDSLQVLSASCRVRMDVWRVLQASLFVTSA